MRIGTQRHQVQNTNLTLRRFFILNGEGFYSIEYHKARASMNYLFHVIRYLPDRLTELTLLYIVYIRPFAMMLSSHGKKNVPDVSYLFCSNSAFHTNQCTLRERLFDLKVVSLIRVFLLIFLFFCFRNFLCFFFF